MLIIRISPTLRWRQVQILDEGWQLECTDPPYKARDEKDSGYHALDGFRPVAFLWRAYNKSESATPWRASLGERGTHRDYATRESAMRWTEKRVAEAQTPDQARSEGMSDATKTLTIGFQIPAGVDLTSEKMAAYKAAIIEGLGAYRSDFEGTDGYEKHRVQVNDLLTES